MKINVGSTLHPLPKERFLISFQLRLCLRRISCLPEEFNASGDILRPAKAPGVKVPQKVKAVLAVPVNPLQIFPGYFIVRLLFFVPSHNEQYKRNRENTQDHGQKNTDNHIPRPSGKQLE